jgi:hypothetical protein
LTEIKNKFQFDVLVEVPSSRTIGNLITKLFHGVKIKKSGGKNEARLLKLIIALSQGSLHQESP